MARACSGVNYLIAVLALGLPLAYLYLRSWWRRAVLIAAALLIAAAANSLRVAMIGALVYYDLGAPLHGPAHVLHGLFVSAIGHVALFVGLWLLGSREQRAAADAPAAASRHAAAHAAAPTVAGADRRQRPALAARDLDARRDAGAGGAGQPSSMDCPPRSGRGTPTRSPRRRRRAGGRPRISS